MKEIIGNMWDYYNSNHIICITTNGTIKKNGECVMGRGNALEAKQKFPQLPKIIGESIKQFGNIPCFIRPLLLQTFPVKHNWWEMADLVLIKESAESIVNSMLKEFIYILPRPGCNNGNLHWEDVKPIIEFLPDNFLIITK